MCQSYLNLLSFIGTMLTEEKEPKKTDREIRLLHAVDLLKAVWSYDYEEWGRS